MDHNLVLMSWVQVKQLEVGCGEMKKVAKHGGGHPWRIEPVMCVEEKRCGWVVSICSKVDSCHSGPACIVPLECHLVEVAWLWGQVGEVHGVDLDC